MKRYKKLNSTRKNRREINIEKKIKSEKISMKNQEIDKKKKTKMMMKKTRVERET